VKLVDLLIPLGAIFGAVLVGAISPGPSFVLVARTSVAVSRSAGLANALGMGAGGLIFAAAALLGLQVALAAVPWAYLGLKIAGGAYLIYLAVQLWRGAREPIEMQPVTSGGAGSLRKFFAVGLATQLSNPKTAIAYASIFTALLPADPPAWVASVILPTIFLIETSWYAVVAMVFSSKGPRRSYLSAKVLIDRLAAGVLGLLGFKLLSEAK
jgi:threonine/homoserine/homoserine lactone efflux protein